MLDMVLAYRKAKVDCFYEQSLSVAKRLAEYEQDIEGRLGSLLKRLRRGGAAAVLGEVALEDTLVVLPKKLKVEPKTSDRDGCRQAVFFSDRQRAVDAAFKNSNVTAELRVSGEFPIDVYVISALWTNLVGHRFDARLGEDVYGARLRRFGDDGTPSRRPYHAWAIGSFPPYFLAYAQWRERGLRACRRALEDGQRVIAVNLDIQSYYHSIDPAFIASPEFREAIGVRGGTSHPSTKDALSRFDRQFTGQVAAFLCEWGKAASGWIAAQGGKAEMGGLPLALTAARVVANVLLAPWDRQIREGLTPLFYGRYVDDMQLVLADPGNLSTVTDVLELIRGRLEPGPVSLKADGSGEKYRIDLGALGGRSKLCIQTSKLRAFFLEGASGRDLIHVIEREIGELSSERRLLPDPDQLTHSIAARVLSASVDATVTPDRLGRADGLSIRRFGWSVQLRQASTLAADLPAAEWSRIRATMFDFACSHILRADRFFDHWDQVPRLIAIAVACGDWAAALKVVRLTSECLADIESRATCVTLNGAEAASGMSAGEESAAWSKLGDHVWSKVREAIVRSWPGSGCGNDERGCGADSQSAKAALLREVGVDPATVEGDCELLTRLDLAGAPVRLCLERVGWGRSGDYPSMRRVKRAFRADGFDRVSAIQEFLQRVVRHVTTRRGRGSVPSVKNIDLRPFLFPTRPYRFQDFAGIDARCLHDAARWRRYAQAFRGVWVGLAEFGIERAGVTPTGGEAAEPSGGDGGEPRWIRLGRRQSHRKVRVALANLRTDQREWAASAAGTPMLTLGRYQKMAELINDVLQARPRPDYLILPELSVPEEWVASITSRLCDSNVNLVAGLEYRHYPNRKVRSHALLLLMDDRLGFTAPVRIDQPKSGPAAREEFDLLQTHGREWRAPKRTQWYRVYEHRGFVFGVLVCSELQDIERRAIFRGRVDALMVPSWNKDLGTFSALVESAALDVHAFVAYVNNREFGDSRVRSPAKADHARDLARIRGGIHDSFVTVEIDPGPLREFQSRSKPWPQCGDAFKPVPTGFVCDPRRRWSYTRGPVDAPDSAGPGEPDAENQGG